MSVWVRVKLNPQTLASHQVGLRVANLLHCLALSHEEGSGAALGLGLIGHRERELNLPGGVQACM